MVTPPNQETVNCFPSVAWRSRCRCGVQVEGVALAAGRRGHRRFDGLGRTLSPIAWREQGDFYSGLAARKQQRPARGRAPPRDLWGDQSV